MNIFVSYSRKDEGEVRHLVADLERAPASVWHDRELRGGDPWWQDILRRIRECHVFVLALSEDSLASKPCQAELSYARRLGVPILPVQIGHVGKLRLTPVADIQVIDYRERSLATGMALLDAVHDSARQRGALPDPLPEAPPVPFEYLFRLGSAIGAAQLTPDQQGEFIRQLRECLETEDDDAARDDARALLRALRRRPDITLRNARAVDDLLAELDDTSGAGPPPPAEDPRPRTGSGAPGPGTADAADPSHQDQPVVELLDGRRSRLRTRLLVGGLVLAILTAVTTGALLVLTTSVVAQPAGTPGPLPFTDPPGAEDAQPAETTADGSVPGDTRGLYDGSGADTCDAGGLATFLDTDRRAAAAWAAVLGIRVDDVRRVLGTFTPVTLRTHTAVTNHGYRDGRATPFQAVLQAGTAVLVDERGVPRVRCACGNPLLGPETRYLTRFEGRVWRGLSSETVTVIAPARESLQEFVLVKSDGEQVVVRPRGTPGDQDVPASAEDAAAARGMSDARKAEEPSDPADTPDPGDDTDPGDGEGEGTDPGTDPGTGGTGDGEGTDGTGDGTGEGTDPGTGDGEGTDGTDPGTGEGTDPGTGDGEGTDGTGDGEGEGTDGTGDGEGTDGTGDGTGEGTDPGTGEGTDGTGDGTGEGTDGTGEGTDPGTGDGEGEGEGTDPGTEPTESAGDGTDEG
ncbi:DUF6777 domain-containing protein [Geodermatophilus sp. SYSU D00758]